MNKIVDYALAQIGSPYVFGGTGQPCTPAYRQARIAQYPEHTINITRFCPVLSEKQSSCTGCKYAGKLAFDCAQLTRLAAKAAGLTLPSGATTQFKTGDWAVKAPIANLPPGQDAFLYRLAADGTVPHTGIALGDGTFVDARGHAYGVMRSPMSSYPWTHYCVLKGQGETQGGGIVTEPTMQTAYIKLKPNENVFHRMKPDQASSSWGRISGGEPVQMIGVENGWVKVIYAGKEGYVASKFITRDKPDQAQPEPVDMAAFAAELDAMADRIKLISGNIRKG